METALKIPQAGPQTKALEYETDELWPRHTRRAVEQIFMGPVARVYLWFDTCSEWRPDKWGVTPNIITEARTSSLVEILA